MNEVNKRNGNGSIEQNHTTDPGHGPNSAAEYHSSSSEWSLRSFRDEAEIVAISSVLQRTGWNRKRAAQMLSISYRGLLYKIRRHNLAPPAEIG
jgi:transcriptional regulator with GAF, ATPase, and Fis domain